MKINTPNSPLKSALTYFIGAIDFEEAEQDIRGIHIGYTYGLEEAIETIEDFLNSDFNILEVRDFVEFEMNRAIGDPSGVLQLEWIKSALALEKKILQELTNL